MYVIIVNSGQKFVTVLSNTNELLNSLMYGRWIGMCDSLSTLSELEPVRIHRHGILRVELLALDTRRKCNWVSVT